ncbi:efflux RND transporter periplasmic adaptor subunit [Candidatus Sumerlaeota bacterium]|nr:efflux RND transporter periplasmic adaptor subunit [Candidatus Sumerlaeota bacterium]
MTTENTMPKGFWKRLWFWVKFLEIRLRFVFLLVLTGIVVGYWENIQNYYERWQRERAGVAEHIGHEAAPSQSAMEEYFCPMHPFVVRSSKGKCPICGMDLARREKGEAVSLPEGVSARVQVSPERIMQSGVKVETVAYRNLVRTVRSYGAIEPDERLQQRLIARFPGRIDELKVRSVGEVVKAGDVLARIYSPEYYALASEYLISWRAWQKAKGTDGEARAKAMMELPRRRLSLTGFSEEQFKEIETSNTVDDRITLHAPTSGTVIERMVLEGDMVENGSPLFTTVDLSRVWVQAQVIESEIAAVKSGMPVEVTLASYPGEIFRGVAGFIYPTVSPETRTVKVRVEIPNPDGRLRPGMYAMVAFRQPMGRMEIVDASALSSTAANPVAPPTRYWCPMHPEVQSDTPGKCDKCGGMNLLKMTPEEYAEHAPHATVTPTDNDTTGTLATGHWTYGWSCAMHPDELEAKPGTCTICGCGMELMPTRIEGVLSIPEIAVVDTGTRKIVYTEFADGVFDAREVVLGPRVGEYYQVLDGLSAGQRIAARGAFLIDAEARLNPVSLAELGEASPNQHQH